MLKVTFLAILLFLWILVISFRSKSIVKEPQPILIRQSPQPVTTVLPIDHFLQTSKVSVVALMAVVAVAAVVALMVMVAVARCCGSDGDVCGGSGGCG